MIAPHVPTPLVCYILIGLPGSGKSALAQKIVEYVPHYRIDLIQKLAHYPNIRWVALHLITPVEHCKQ